MRKMKVIKNKRSLLEVYPDAFVRFSEKLDLDNIFKYDQMSKEELIQYIFLGIKSINTIHQRVKQKKNINLLSSEYALINNIVLAITYITPRDLIQIFPIKKEYNGEKYGIKDYYYSIQVMREAGLDKIMREEEKVLEILWNLTNTDIKMFIVALVSCVNDIDYLQIEKSLLAEFLHKNDIDDETKIKEKKKRASQFKIIKK